MRIFADSKIVNPKNVEWGEVKKPTPPSLTNFRIVPESEMNTLPKRVAKDGTWYGHALNAKGTIRKSSDEGVTWTDIFNFRTLGGVYEWCEVAHVLPLANGELLVTFWQRNRVQVSSTGQTQWTELELTPDSWINWWFGWDTYDNIVLLTEYGAYSIENTPAKTYLSQDYGQTWSVIRTVTGLYDYHTHDVAYDPFAHRIWVAYGDFPQYGNITYSDDFGETWTDVYPVQTVVQPTALHPTPQGLIIGSDEEPDGVYLWKRDMSEPQKKAVPKDIERIYKFGHYTLGDIGLGHIARKGTFINGVLYIPFTAHRAEQGQAGYSRIIATPDGENFWEVWRNNRRDHTGIASVVGINGNGKLVGAYRGTNPVYYIMWEADPIEWKV